MPNYPIRSARMAAAGHYPARLSPFGVARRKLIRAAIGPLLDPVQRARQTQLSALPAPADRVVFAGDSITEQGEWAEWFPELSVLNRGVGGETAAQVLARLDQMLNRPTAFVLLVGTNDIASGLSTEEIVTNIRRIVYRIQSAAPGTPVLLQSIMPRALGYREEILFVNEQLKLIAAEHPDTWRYLDLWPALATPAGALRPTFTEDKLHLNGAGYLAWVSVLRPAIAEILPPSRTPSAGAA